MDEREVERLLTERAKLAAEESPLSERAEEKVRSELSALAMSTIHNSHPRDLGLGLQEDLGRVVR